MVGCTFSTVGTALKRLGHYELAHFAFLETAYFEQASSMNATLINQAPLWLEVAECIYRFGNRDLAWVYLMKVGVFGSEQHLEQVKEIATFWIEREEKGIGLPEQEQLTQKERQEIAQGIVNAYLPWNAHPRAWAFIKQYPENFEDPEQAIREVQDAWLAVINPLLDSAKSFVSFVNADWSEHFPEGHVFPEQYASLVVFNQQLYPDGIDPLDVTIPWAFSGDSVERARATLLEAFRIALLDNEPRRWRTADGEREYVGKFVSANEISVTLEPVEMVSRGGGFAWQPDGESITFALSELSADDQKYVRLRLAAEEGSDIFAARLEDLTQ